MLDAMKHSFDHTRSRFAREVSERRFIRKGALRLAEPSVCLFWITERPLRLYRNSLQAKRLVGLVDA